MTSVFGLDQEASDGCRNNQKAINSKRCPTNSCSAGQAGCKCTVTVNGNKRCLKFDRQDCDNRRCDSNGDCAGDEVCIKAGGCCGGKRQVRVRTC